MRRPKGKLRAATLVTMALLGGLVTVAPQIASAATTQNGINNCAAPAQSDCPTLPVGQTWTYSNATDVVQTTSLGTGRNFFKCTFQACSATQSNASQNDAIVNSALLSSAALQTVNITQTAPTNNITIGLTSTADTGRNVSLAAVSQKNRQIIKTSQNGATNTLNETAAITQNATSNFTAAKDVSHYQQEMICSTNQMIASVKNTANFSFTRSQTSTTQGAPIHIYQDAGSDTEPPGCLLGLGSLNLDIKSDGENAIKLVKATDTKLADSTSLNAAQVVLHRQGADGQGWLIGGSMDTAVENTAVCDLYLGTPNGDDGARKTWTSVVKNAFGNPQKNDVRQLDTIKIPFLSKSPFCWTSNLYAKLTAPLHALQQIREEISGEAKNPVEAQMTGILDAGGGVKEEHFDAGGTTNPDASLGCDGVSNDNDTCEAHANASSTATMGVKGPSDEGYSDSTTVNPGDQVQYHGTFDNAGPGDATNATLSWTVPSGMSFVGGEGCNLASGVVTCDVGDVPAGSSGTADFSAQVNKTSNPGPFVSHLVGADDTESGINSNDTTVNVNEPSSTLSAAVRNVTQGGSFASTGTANPNDTLEYQGTFNNAGPGPATTAAMTATIPANTTYIAGSCGSCTQSGNTLTWNLGDVTGSQSRTFQTTVNGNTPGGSSLTSNVGGSDDEEGTLAGASATATTPVVTQPTLTVKIKIYNDSILGTRPVSMLSQADDSNPATLDNALLINPSTVCFGRTVSSATKDCSGRVTSTGDANNDGRRDLTMVFSTARSGTVYDFGTACITAKTTGGQNVQGCGQVP